MHVSNVSFEIALNKSSLFSTYEQYHPSMYDSSFVKIEFNILSFSYNSILEFDFMMV